MIQFLRGKGFQDADILEASLAKRNAHGEIYAFFRNRITFPICDAMGNVVGFSARVLNPEDKPKYLNSAEHKAFEKSKVLYGLNLAKNSIREQQKLIIVEGQMDVLGLARLEVPVGVATSGTALSSDHIKLIKRYTENVYLLFDNDQAGQQAILRSLKLFYQQNIFPKVIRLPHGVKDVDELANTPEGNSVFEMCLKNAQDGFLSVYIQLREHMDLTSPIDKQKLITTLFELILSVNSLTIQEHYKQLLAEKLGFAFEILDAQFKRFKVGDGKVLLMQQQRQQEQEVKQNYQLERDLLFIALFFQERIFQYLSKTEKVVQLFAFVQLLAQSDPECLLAKALQNKLDPQQIEQLDTLSLWWDKHLEELGDEERRYAAVLQVILPYLQRQLQVVLKLSSLSPDLKAQLLEMRKIF